VTLREFVETSRHDREMLNKFEGDMLSAAYDAATYGCPLLFVEGEAEGWVYEMAFELWAITFDVGP